LPGSPLYLTRERAGALSRELAEVLDNPDQLKHEGIDPVKVQALKLQVDTALNGWLEP
jgi:hypothetical protein